ncbi:hypothetical protein GCM10011514_39870 [Emticicia aquatilis]|uniref:Uncharacterized protein n=1 Tax=Emticicia aquatilis TaxID=1537369 RepID=A0A916Z1Q9_9BACT|nr:hypothetical protein [Emticicia aquatilis]GGD71792.1 hypothetical protein GCM10011514_39870 [Emticicia aquatilis]
MVEFKLQLDEAFVQTLGYNQIENYLKEHLRKLQLKASAKDILADLEESDLINDEQWQLSRNMAWEQEKSKFLF